MAAALHDQTQAYDQSVLDELRELAQGTTQQSSDDCTAAYDPSELLITDLIQEELGGQESLPVSSGVFAKGTTPADPVRVSVDEQLGEDDILTAHFTRADLPLPCPEEPEVPADERDTVPPPAERPKSQHVAPEPSAPERPKSYHVAPRPPPLPTAIEHEDPVVVETSDPVASLADSSWESCFKQSDIPTEIRTLPAPAPPRAERRWLVSAGVFVVAALGVAGAYYCVLVAS